MATATDAHEHVVLALTSADPHSARFLEQRVTIFTSTRLIVPRRLWEGLGCPNKVTLTISAGDRLGVDDDLDIYSYYDDDENCEVDDA